MYVAVEYLHACFCENHRVKSVFSRSLEGFLIDECAVPLCFLYHFNCEILISHGTQSFHPDEQVGDHKFGCKCQVGGTHSTDHFGTFSRFVRSEASEKKRLLTALPCLPGGPWSLMIRHRDLVSTAIFATVLLALLKYNSVADNFLRTPSDALLTFLKSMNSEIASMYPNLPP